MPKWVAPSLGFVGCIAVGQVAWDHSRWVVVIGSIVIAILTLIALGARYETKS